MEGIIYGKLYFDTGELQYEGYIKNNMPYGRGVKYYKNGTVHMEGIFGDWMIEEGKEYYENGNLKYEGTYNKGARNYYGPRYYRIGKLYKESGHLCYDGTFNIQKQGNLGYPLFKGAASFYTGTEYDELGDVVKTYVKQSGMQF